MTSGQPCAVFLSGAVTKTQLYVYSCSACSAELRVAGGEDLLLIKGTWKAAAFSLPVLFPSVCKRESVRAARTSFQEAHQVQHRGAYQLSDTDPADLSPPMSQLGATPFCVPMLPLWLCLQPCESECVAQLWHTS